MSGVRARSGVTGPSGRGRIGLIASVVGIWLAGYDASAAPGWGVSINPGTVVAGTSNTIVQTVTAGAVLNNGPALTTLIPAGWTAPQTKLAGGGGYVKTVAGTCAAAGTAAVTGTGPWTVSVTGVRCAVGQTFGLSYAKASATAAGPYTFGPLSQSGSVLFAGLPVAVTPAATSRLSVTGYPTPTLAGSVHSFTVSATDAYGNATPAYGGRVRFTSSDSKATLPADYTFNGGDAGVHSFDATLNTIGSRSLTATDTATKSITGTQSAISVVPGPTSALAVAGYSSPVNAGTSRTFTVTARDAGGNTATGYRGTVTFTSSDTQAVLPAPYAFTAADAGVHTFAATLKTAGNNQSITATDAALVGSQSGIVVRPLATRKLLVAGYPTPTDLGASHTFTVTAQDTYGNTTPAYTGTVGFSSTDARAALPASYPFVAADAGVHIFSAALKSAGTRALTATDLAVPATMGSQTGIAVNQGHLTVSASNEAMSYGGALPSVTPSYAGLVSPDTAPTTLPTCVALPAVPATRCSGAADANYAIDYQDGTLTIDAASVTVAVTGSQVYGGSPVFTPDYSSSVFVAGEDSSVVTGTLSCDTDATSSSSVGDSYSVSNCTGLSASNYDISYSYGSLSVTPASVTVGVSGTQVYGGSPVFTPDYSSSVFVAGDDSSVVTGTLACTTDATSSSPVDDDYSVSDCTGLSASNYDIGYSYGSLSVTPAPLTVAVSGSQVYGGSPGFTPDYTSSAFVAGNDSSVVTGTLACTTDATSSSPVDDDYSVSDCSGLSAPNYDLGYAYGSLSVTPAPATVTAKDKTISEGDLDPTFDYDVSGLINSDTLTDVICGVTEDHSTPGDYPITCAGNTNTNYDADYEDGTLTVQGAVGPGSCGSGTHTTSTTCTYVFTGAADQFTVPGGVYQVTIDAMGAQGGNSQSNLAVGGLGGEATATVSVTPGAVLQVTVGGRGASGAACLIPSAGGFNGGGAAPGSTDYSYSFSCNGGGGGGSDVRTGSCATTLTCSLAQRVVVGGGGGGAGRSNTPAGAGGGLSGGNGSTAPFGAGGGAGGTQAAGGAGGSTGGGSGAFGQGGAGGLGYCCGIGGGGGGGGWYGGGGGGQDTITGGGGGGGSGYGPVGTTFLSGVRAGDGQITISWSTGP